LKLFSYREILALIAGCLLVFAFAPFEFYPLAVICPAVLFLLWLNCTPKQGFIRGLLFGLGFFGIGVSWVFISIHNFGNANIFLAGLITFLFVFLYAIFFAFSGFFLAKFFPLPTKNKLLLTFPCSWALLELFRSWFMTGFPWLLLGASQTSSPLRGLIPIVGELGLSFLVSLSSALLIMVIVPWFSSVKKYFPVTRPQQIFSGVSLLLMWGLGAVLIPIQWTQPFHAPFEVALVQGNIPQQMKWTQEYILSSIERYVKLTQPVWNKPLIIWPETAIPLFANDAQNILNELSQKAKNNHAVLITGIPVQEGFDYYNAAIALGVGKGEYLKRHLVPFGEFVPFSKLFGSLLGFLNIPMSSFSEGPAHQGLIQMQGIQIGMYICYEIIFPSLVLSDLPQANLLVTISDDAWFGHSFASAQHLQMGQMRAMETGRYLLFSSNTGITAIVDTHGKIIARAPEFQPTVLTGTVQAMSGSTPCMRLGMAPIIGFILALFIIAVVLQRRENRKNM
jgi:apolipoprotein N-acyltransferase